MYRFKLNKLVRDKILDKMINDQFILEQETLTENEYVIALKEKIVEEALEVKHSKSNEEFLCEMGDVLEVMESLLKTLGFDLNDVKKHSHNKKVERGGFTTMTKVISIQCDENKPSHLEWIDYFKKDPGKYPII